MKPYVWVWRDGSGGWFVGVDADADTLVAATRGNMPLSGGHEYQSRASALRAAERIGDALGLRVKTET